MWADPIQTSAVEEPPGDPQALRKAARVLGVEATRGFTDTSKVLEVAVADVTAADWQGEASSTWAFSARGVGNVSVTVASTAAEASTVLETLAAKIEEAKQRAEKARSRADRAVDTMGVAELGLSELGCQKDPDPGSKARLQDRREGAGDDLDAARTDAGQAAEDARRAARVAAKALTALARRVPELSGQPTPPIPVTPAMFATDDPFAPGSRSPGEVLRQMRWDELARIEAEEERRNGGLLDAVGGGLSGFAGFHVWGDTQTDAYKGWNKVGTVAGYVPLPSNLGKLAVKQADKRGAKEGGEEVGQSAAKKGPVRSWREKRKARQDAWDEIPPDERRRMDREAARQGSIQKAGEAADFTIPGAGAGSQALSYLAHKEIRDYLRVQARHHAPNAMKRAEREVAKIRVQMELRHAPRGPSREQTRKVRPEVRPR